MRIRVDDSKRNVLQVMESPEDKSMVEIISELIRDHSNQNKKTLTKFLVM
jgi:hypothetical protein